MTLFIFFFQFFNSLYSLIEPQPLSCTPACCYQFGTAAVHPPPTPSARGPKFTARLIESVPGIRTKVCGGALLKKQSTCWSSVVDV